MDIPSTSRENKTKLLPWKNRRTNSGTKVRNRELVIQKTMNAEFFSSLQLCNLSLCKFVWLNIFYGKWSANGLNIWDNEVLRSAEEISVIAHDSKILIKNELTFLNNTK